MRWSPPARGAARRRGDRESLRARHALGQLAFVENDPGSYHPQFWLDYFERTHLDAVTLSAGGVVAFYPTRVPFHHRSAWMKEGMDPFGEMAAACRRRGMLVVARVDPHAVYEDARDAHPEWIAVDEKGQPRRHWANPELWVTCALGPGNFEHMSAVVREIATLHDVQGNFANRWAGHGTCYCEHCRRAFRAASGKDLPRESPGDPAGSLSVTVPAVRDHEVVAVDL